MHSSLSSDQSYFYRAEEVILPSITHKTLHFWNKLDTEPFLMIAPALTKNGKSVFFNNDSTFERNCFIVFLVHYFQQENEKKIHAIPIITLPIHQKKNRYYYNSSLITPFENFDTYLNTPLSLGDIREVLLNGNNSMECFVILGSIKCLTRLNEYYPFNNYGSILSILGSISFYFESDIIDLLGVYLNFIRTGKRKHDFLCAIGEGALLTLKQYVTHQQQYNKGYLHKLSVSPSVAYEIISFVPIRKSHL